MSRGVVFLTCALCATMTAGLFAQQQSGYDRDEGWTDQDRTWQDQRDSGRMGQSWRDDRSQDRQAYRDEWDRQDQGYRQDQAYRQDQGYRQDRGYSQDRAYRDWEMEPGTAMRDEYWGPRDRDTGMRGQQQWGRDFDRRAMRDQDFWGYRGRDMDGGMTMRDRMMGRMRDRMADEGQRLAVIGQIVSVDARIPGVNPDHKVAQVRTEQGTTLFVDLGPANQIQDMDLSQDQSIFARGNLSNISGHPVLAAREVARITQRVNIDRRDQDRMMGQRQQDQSRQDQIYGYTDDQQKQKEQQKQKDQSKKKDVDVQMHQE